MVAAVGLWWGHYGSTDVMAYRGDRADPCELFATAAVCPEIAARLVELGL